MNENDLVRLTSLITLLAAGGLLGGRVTAQPVETVTVEAAREVRVGQTTTGIPISEITVRSHVSYADLDLGTETGARELEDRIRAAAVAACREMDLRVPVEGSSEAKCAKRATDEALAEARKVIAAKRGGR